MSPFRLVVPCLFLLGLSPTLLAQTTAGTRPVTVLWPSTQYRDLQAAIDAAPDGATVRIKAGVYPIAAPINVQDRRLTIVGEGSGRGRGTDSRVSELDGPVPRAVTDGRGAIILPASAVQGLWNLSGSEVTLADMKLTGFDAGVVTRPDAAGLSAPTTVRGVVISATGRGILSQAAADLNVETTTILDAQWNGISFAPSTLALAPPHLLVHASTIAQVAGAGIYFAGGFGFLDEVQVSGASLDGIHGFESNCVIKLSSLFHNTKNGIELQGGKCDITGNVIYNTAALPDNYFGDGISLVVTTNMAMDATVTGNYTLASARAGLSLYAGTATLQGNTISCSVFDLDGESVQGQPYSFIDAGQNVCGCNGNPQPCKAGSSMLAPPPPTAGLE